MHCLLHLLNSSRPQNSGLAQIWNECNQWSGEVIDIHERSGKCIKSAETIIRKEYKSFVRASKPTLAPYGPLWPLLGEITLKLSNSKTFKLSNFQGAIVAGLATTQELSTLIARADPVVQSYSGILSQCVQGNCTSAQQLVKTLPGTFNMSIFQLHSVSVYFTYF